MSPAAEPEKPAVTARSPIKRWRPLVWHYKDVAPIAALPFQLLVADLLPERGWSGLGKSLAWIRSSRQPRWRAREIAHIAHYLGLPADDPQAARAHLELLRWLEIRTWMTLAARRPDGWKPIHERRRQLESPWLAQSRRPLAERQPPSAYRIVPLIELRAGRRQRDANCGRLDSCR